MQEQRRLLVIMIFRTDVNVAGPRGKLHRLAFGQRLVREGVIAFVQQSLQQRMFRVVRLQHHLALLTRSTSATGNLGIKLGETLGGAKIRGEQRAVDVQQGDQRHVREVVPFRQNLSTNQDARAAAMYFRKLLFQRPFTAGGIPVDTGDGHVREEGRERLFKLFRSQTDRHDVR